MRNSLLMVAALNLTLGSGAVMAENLQDLIKQAGAVVRSEFNDPNIQSPDASITTAEYSQQRLDDFEALFAHKNWSYDELPYAPIVGALSVPLDHDGDGNAETYLPFYDEQGNVVLLSLTKAAEVSRDAVEIRKAVRRGPSIDEDSTQAEKDAYNAADKLSSQAFAVGKFVKRSQQTRFLQETSDDVSKLTIIESENEPSVPLAEKFNNEADVAPSVEPVVVKRVPPQAPRRDQPQTNENVEPKNPQISDQEFKGGLLGRMSPPEGGSPKSVYYAMESTLNEIHATTEAALGGQSGLPSIARFTEDQLEQVVDVWEDKHPKYSAVLEDVVTRYNNGEDVDIWEPQDGAIIQAEKVRDNVLDANKPAPVKVEPKQRVNREAEIAAAGEAMKADLTEQLENMLYKMLLAEKGLSPADGRKDPDIQAEVEVIMKAAEERAGEVLEDRNESAPPPQMKF